MSDFNLDTSQSSSGDFNMDNFTNYDFDSNHFLDQGLQPSYANGPQHNESIRPSDLDASAFNDMGMFGPSRSTELPLQIDPTLAETKADFGGQQRRGQPLTPPTSLSPEHFDASGSYANALHDSAIQGKSNKPKRKTAEVDNGGVDAERRFKNRVAASKCRIKKKGREQILIQESDQKEHENLELRAEYRRLTQEALWYKNQLITHGNCGDPRINQWLTNSAAKIVHNVQKFGDGPAFQLDASSNPAIRPSVEVALERRDSGISTNSKAESKVGPGSSPLVGRPLSVNIGLGSPVEAIAQDVQVSPVQLKFEPDDDLLDGESMRRAKSLDHSTLDTLASVAAKRTTSVPLDEPDTPKNAALHRNGLHQDPSMERKPATAVPEIAESNSTVPWNAQLPANALTIDPRLRGGNIPLDSINAGAEYYTMPVQQVEQTQDILQQIPETKWMEA